MKLKHSLFQRLKSLSGHYRIFKYLAIVQIIITIALPVIWTDMDTGLWLLSLAVFAFWMSNYALLRMAHHYDPQRRGFLGWVNGLWENLLVITWAILFAAMIFLSVKLILFIW